MTSPQTGRDASSSADPAVPTGLAAFTPAVWPDRGTARHRSRADRRATRSSDADRRVNIAAALHAHTLRSTRIGRDRNGQPRSGRRHNKQISPHCTFPSRSEGTACTKPRGNRFDRSACLMLHRLMFSPCTSLPRVERVRRLSSVLNSPAPRRSGARIITPGQLHAGATLRPAGSAPPAAVEVRPMECVYRTMEVVPAVKEDDAMVPAMVPPPGHVGHRVDGLGGKPHVRSCQPERRSLGAIRYQRSRPEHCRRRGDGESDPPHFFLLAIGSRREPAERTKVNAMLKTLVPCERVDERDKNRRRSSPVHRLEHGRRHCLHDHRESGFARCASEPSSTGMRSAPFRWPLMFHHVSRKLFSDHGSQSGFRSGGDGVLCPLVPAKQAV